MSFSSRPLFFLLTLGAPLLAASCQTPQKAIATPVPSRQSASVPQPTPALQVTAITMSNGYCFGKCPVYDLAIANTGMARYVGYKHVIKEGVYEKMLDKTATVKLLKEFSDARPDTMQTRYEKLVSDLPGLDYTFTFSNGTTKKIQNAHFGPQVLAGLTREMTNLIGLPDYSWKKVADQAPEEQ